MGLAGLLAILHIGIYIWFAWEGPGNPWIRTQTVAACSLALAWAIPEVFGKASFNALVVGCAACYGVYLMWTFSSSSNRR